MNHITSTDLVVLLGYKRGFPFDFVQKKVTDDKGIKYFINAQETEMSSNANFHSVWELKVQFQQVTDLDTFTISYGIRSDQEIADVSVIEKRFETLWNKIGKPYYEEY